MADVTNPMPSAVTTPGVGPGNGQSVVALPSGVAPLPPPTGPIQIMLPAELQAVMQQFPEVVKRVSAVEGKVGAVPTSAPPPKLVAALAFLCGVGLMALLTWLWWYAAVIFRL